MTKFDDGKELLHYLQEIFEKTGVSEDCRICAETTNNCQCVLAGIQCKDLTETGCSNRNWFCSLYLCDRLKRKYPEVRDYLRYLKENVRVKTYSVTKIITPVEVKEFVHG